MFSTLYAAGAYDVLPVGKKTRPLLAFMTPFGLYQFKRLPFGVRNAMSCYSCFMDTLVSRVRTELIIVYLNDITLATKDEEEHLRDLEKFSKLSKCGDKIDCKENIPVPEICLLFGILSVTGQHRDAVGVYGPYSELAHKEDNQTIHLMVRLCKLLLQLHSELQCFDSRDEWAM